MKGEPALSYQPFEKSRIKEFGALETLCIPLTDDLPPDVAAIVSDPPRLLRVLSPEEQEMATALFKYYDHDEQHEVHDSQRNCKY